MSSQSKKGVYASMLNWQKSESGANHWTLRRSLRRGSVRKNKDENAGAGSDAPKRRSLTKTLVSKSKKIVETMTKASSTVSSEEGEVIVNKVKIGGSIKGYEVIDSKSGARVKVALFGGTLTSYRGGDGKQRLFHSKKTKLDKSKAIRAGVPVVFPQFGNDGPLSSHGFARTAMWTLCDGELAPHRADGMIHLAMKLTENSSTMKVWPHKFELIHHIRFGVSELETSMKITNTGNKTFKFEALLHSYLRIKNTQNLVIEGLKGLDVIDKLPYVMPGEDRLVLREDSNAVKIVSETDNVYLDAGARTITVRAERDNYKCSVNMLATRNEKAIPCDAVVWNPGPAKSKRTSDMGDDEWPHMLCLEPGIASRYETCAAGDFYTITQHMRFSRISKYGVRSGKTMGKKKK
mmetsp:Transcript_3973/g.6972  ORF Transcript_3973/g.6972 Transcript_3973/m.6972 type:complete len:406 (-) Transcript_3973:150-1367(-)